MDEKKICFIMCVNHERHQREALYYINRLNVPDGYTVEALTVREAHGMAAGYNEAMTASDAKYKVYLHQDVLIVERDFLFSLLELFQDSRIGMVGMVGAPKLSPDGVMWNGPRVGKIYSSTVDCMNAVTFGEIGKGGAKQRIRKWRRRTGFCLRRSMTFGGARMSFKNGISMMCPNALSSESKAIGSLSRKWSVPGAFMTAGM